MGVPRRAHQYTLFTLGLCVFRQIVGGTESVCVDQLDAHTRALSSLYACEVCDVVRVYLDAHVHIHKKILTLSRERVCKYVRLHTLLTGALFLMGSFFSPLDGFFSFLFFS